MQHLRPEGPTHLSLCRPSGPEILFVRKPVAHATGIGYVDPPGLKMRNFKTGASGLYAQWFFSICRCPANEERLLARGASFEVARTGRVMSREFGQHADCLCF